MTYDATGVQAYFDTLAGREWERLEATVQGRSNYAVHRCDGVNRRASGLGGDALGGAGLRVEVLATANPLIPQFSKIPRIAESAAATAAVIDLELAVCDWPGLVDAGGHILAVARRNQ